MGVVVLRVNCPTYRGSCPIGVIVLSVDVPRGSCPGGNWQSGSCPMGVTVLQGDCPQGSCPQGSCPRSSCPRTHKFTFWHIHKSTSGHVVKSTDLKLGIQLIKHRYVEAKYCLSTSNPRCLHACHMLDMINLLQFYFLAN